MWSKVVILLLGAALLCDAGKRQTTPKGCYDEIRQQCFVDYNIDLAACTNSQAYKDQINNMGKCMVDAVGGSICATSAFYMSILQGMERQAQEICQNDHCLVPLGNCVGKIKDYWNQLPLAAGDAGIGEICTEFNKDLKSCLDDVAYKCDNVGLRGIRESINGPESMNAYQRSFCAPLITDTCLLASLSTLPSSHLSFSETGQIRLKNTCTDRDTVSAALTNAELTKCSMPNPFNMDIMYESIVSQTNRIVYVSTCANLCQIEASRCFVAYFGETGKDIKCSTAAASLASCLDQVLVDNTCGAEAAAIATLKTDMEDKC